MDKKRIKKEFQSDPTYLFNIGQYFSNHRDILKDNGVDKATLVMWQHEAINKSDQMTRDFLDSKRKPVERITGLFDLSLNGYYMPNRDTLTRSVETLELIAKSENKEYWDILFIYDEADKKGSSAHNVAVNDLMIDYEIFEKLWPPQDAGLIISEPGRFGGLLPYLFNHGFQDLYKKAFSIITRKLRENFVEMISIAISLLQFSALPSSFSARLRFPESRALPRPPSFF